MKNAKLNSERSLPLPAGIQALELANTAFLLCNSKAALTYISTKAAQVLAIPDRTSPEKSTQILSELLELTRHIVTRASQAPLKNAGYATSRELVLPTKDGRSVHVIANAQALLPHQQDAFEGLGQVLIQFHETTPANECLSLLHRAQHLRPQAILAQSLLGENINVSKATEISLDSVLERTITPADLADGVSRSVDMIDSLLSPSVKVLVECSSSALLEVSQAAFTRIVAHLLIEASDFVGPSGEIRVQTTFAGINSPSGSDKGGSAEVLVLANHKQPKRYELSLIEEYLIRKVAPATHRVTVLSEEPTINQMLSGNKTLSAVTRDSDDSLLIAPNASLSNERLSANALLVIGLAAKVGATIQFRKPKPDLLSIYSRFPLFNIPKG